MSRLTAILLLLCALALAQNPEYDFYPGYRDFAATQFTKDPKPTPDQVHAAYAAKLKSEGVPDAEIERRETLLRTVPRKLEADRWNRFYLSGDSNYNREPNAYLKEVVAGRRPGVALDYDMGTGRNALYLAKLGWDAYGFDMSDVAVSIADKHARELGVTLHATAAPDTEYDFGHQRFDLILFSWAMPFVNMKKIVNALKPGGMVVMGAGADYVGRNGMLKMFDPLRIVHYEIIHAQSDFYDRRDTDIIRMIAVKP